MKIRTRFAPSPTGYMHIGNLRTALYCYLIAKKEKGDFILRIEDTDQKREVAGAFELILQILDETGLHYDEGPEHGHYGPYIQSQRLDIYHHYAQELIKLGGAHYCFCLDDIEEHDPCLDLSPDDIQRKIQNGEPYVIRQTIPQTGITSFDDEVYGHIEVENKTLNEGILIKSDGFPTYNFANVIDDHLMHITHVVRGNEYLSSTPKYNLIYDAYGWQRPTYVHVPPVMKDEHHKLSKRNGDASFQDLVAKGYLPEAIINYIALLGWSPETDQEIYSLEELIQVFNIHRISKRPAIFDIDKLTWMNGEYLKHMDFDRYYALIEPKLKEAITRSIDLKEVAKLVQSRADTLNEIPEMIDFFEALPDYDLEMYKHKRQKSKKETALVALKEAYRVLQDCSWESEEVIHDLLMALPEALEMKNGQVLWPVRTALTGKQSTPGGAIEVAYILGKEESLSRIQMGITRLEKDLESA